MCTIGISRWSVHQYQALYIILIFVSFFPFELTKFREVFKKKYLNILCYTGRIKQSWKKIVAEDGTVISASTLGLSLILLTILRQLILEWI